MFKMVNSWYNEKFADPAAVTLVGLILLIFVIVYFLHPYLMPFFIALFLAYLLDSPVNFLEKQKLPRTVASFLIVFLFITIMFLACLILLPMLWEESLNLVKEFPVMIDNLQEHIFSLQKQYPDIIKNTQIDEFSNFIRQKSFALGEVFISNSLGSISSLVYVLVYTILVPFMLFFLLKDKRRLQAAVRYLLPRNRNLLKKLTHDMNLQIINYIRGKLIEIIIIATASYLIFIYFDLNYAILLAVLVGFSVLIPYVGATIVTFPIAIVSIFQFGISSHTGYLLLSYLILQAVDGNILVPLLFSEAVNLHPIVIIISVLIFGGIWGVWGVFFAIPLATFIKAVIKAWPKKKLRQ